MPDLALVDIKLAGPMDGIEVAQLLRRRFNVPSIFLSGVADPAMMRAGAQGAAPLGFLEKPFRPSQVFNALQRALARSRRASPLTLSRASPTAPPPSRTARPPKSCRSNGLLSMPPPPLCAEAKLT